MVYNELNQYKFVFHQGFAEIMVENIVVIATSPAPCFTRVVRVIRLNKENPNLIFSKKLKKLLVFSESTKSKTLIYSISVIAKIKRFNHNENITIANIYYFTLK